MFQFENLIQRETFYVRTFRANTGYLNDNHVNYWKCTSLLFSPFLSHDASIFYLQIVTVAPGHCIFVKGMAKRNM